MKFSRHENRAILPFWSRIVGTFHQKLPMVLFNKQRHQCLSSQPIFKSFSCFLNRSVGTPSQNSQKISCTRTFHVLQYLVRSLRKLCGNLHRISWAKGLIKWSEGSVLLKLNVTVDCTMLTANIPRLLKNRQHDRDFWIVQTGE